MPQPDASDRNSQSPQTQGPRRALERLNMLRSPLRAGKGAQVAVNLAKTKVLIWVAAGIAVLLLLGVLFLLVVGMAGASAGGTVKASCEGENAGALGTGGGVVVGASEYGGPGDRGTIGDKGSFIAHLTGHMAYAELGLSGANDGNWEDAHKLGDALGTGKALPPDTKLLITANGHSVIAEKLDTGAGGGPVGSPPHERAIDLWYETAAQLGLDTTSSGQWSGLVTVQLVGSTATASSTPATTPAQTSSGVQAPAQPRIISNPIPFGQKRRDEMRAYALRHYGIDSYELNEPKVIVEHFTEGHTWQEAYNTFARDAPDPELHELPGTASHFIIDQNGGIHQVLPLNLMGRHTVGLNYTAIGIEMVGMSDQEILRRPPELDAALALTRWLQSKYGISTSDVIGHNESLTSPYHLEHIARLKSQTHNDWNKSDMEVFRSKLGYEPPTASPAQTAAASEGLCEQTMPAQAGELGAKIVQIARGELGKKEWGSNCNPYGPCESWCSDFLTWVWKRAGVNIDRMPYSGSVYEWGKKNTKVLPASATPEPGDAVEFGTGPGPGESDHVGIVEQVFPNGEIIMISGNWGNEVGRSKSFQPAQAQGQSGAEKPIYGYVVP